MTAGFQPSMDGCHLVIAENWTMNCSNMRSGVFPCLLKALQEGCQCHRSTFYPNFDPVHELRTPVKAVN